MAVWVRFGFQLGLRQWEALIIIYTLLVKRSDLSENFSDFGEWCRLQSVPPSAVGRVENQMNPNGHHSFAVWVRFGFQLDSLEKK